MAICAVVFDIGGVVELTPSTGWQQRWADELCLPVAELERRIGWLWRPGQIEAASPALIRQKTALALGLDPAQLQRLSDDIWTEYLGTLNEPLLQHFRGLRPRYRTGLLSNSIVGAREREQSAYGLEDMCDVLVYSHEEGMAKPDPRFYQLICGRLGVAPCEAVFLDDKLACVDGRGPRDRHARSSVRLQHSRARRAWLDPRQQRRATIAVILAGGQPYDELSLVESAGLRGAANQSASASLSVSAAISAGSSTLAAHAMWASGRMSKASAGR